MSYQPYSPNAQGFTEALIDLKTNYQGQITNKVNGFEAEAFENLVQGDAVFSRASDGKLGKAIANDTQDKARVVGFVETTTSSGNLVFYLQMQQNLDDSENSYDFTGRNISSSDYANTGFD